jgi:ATP-dependent Clp protease ATP-binding subunit ClpA
VLLFDEVDKAHVRLFDFFLQIFEDGRLTDGRGSTVHFTECILIFTSNLGRTDPGAPPGVGPRFIYKDDPDEVRRVLRQSFENFFDRPEGKGGIGCPELRNRLGNAFIAMDFIQPPVVPALLDKAIASLTKRVAVVHEVRLEIAPEAMRMLHERAVANLDHGGRRQQRRRVTADQPAVPAVAAGSAEARRGVAGRVADRRRRGVADRGDAVLRTSRAHFPVTAGTRVGYAGRPD